MRNFIDKEFVITMLICFMVLGYGIGKGVEWLVSHVSLVWL